MKKYTFLIFILFLSLILLCGCSKKDKDLSDLDVIKERGYIIIGVKSDTPPFGYIDKKGNRKGIDIEISKAIADNIFGENRGKIKYVNVTTQNRISKLNNKDVDILVATVSVNEKRKLVMDFSIPYYVSYQKLMVRESSKITNLHYFNKHGRLAVVMGSIGDRVARMIVPNAQVYGAKTHIEAVRWLSNGKVDGILDDDCILDGLKNSTLKIVNRAYSREFYAVAVRKSEKSKELLRQVNSAVALVLDKKGYKLLKEAEKS